MNNFKEPVKYKKAFTCPHCSAYAEQIWVKKNLTKLDNGKYNLIDEQRLVGIFPYPKLNSNKEIEVNRYMANISIAICQVCEGVNIWVDDKMIYPNVLTAPLAHEDMPENIKEIFNEAREVYVSSARAAAALLRLATQCLCEELGYKNMSIDNAIKNMIKDGLDRNLEKSLDILRIIGNNAVHPGKINLNDNKDIVLGLFNILNFIVKEMITRPKEIEEMYKILPESNIKSIEQRNEKINK